MNQHKSPKPEANLNYLGSQVIRGWVEGTVRQSDINSIGC